MIMMMMHLTAHTLPYKHVSKEIRPLPQMSTTETATRQQESISLHCDM